MSRHSTPVITRAPKLILASASPRRREILKAAGIAFEAMPTSVLERQRRGERASAFVKRLAAEKAEAARALVGESSNRPVLGADTVVVIQGITLGKPRSHEDARRMIKLLSGRRHRVLTGLCLLFRKGQKWRRDVRVATTTVKFRRLTDGEIQDYVRSGEPADKAGAYAIQGRASKYIEWIEGCYFNVVGLPVSLLYDMLKKAGLVVGDRSPQE